MRIVGWPEDPDADGGIFPVSIADVDFHGTPEEIRSIAALLLRAADELDRAQANNLELNVGVELENSNSEAGVGIWVNVVRQIGE
jgi:hypothetical protein